MPAMILKPPGFDPSLRYPVVIYVYGGRSAPTVANAWGGRARDYFEQILAHQGYVVLRVDNRSATAQSKELENRILYQAYGESELADLLDAVKWLKSQPFVDPQRVGIWGWSGGGSFTLLAMTASKEFKAGVAVAAVSDWRYYDTKYTEAVMKRPQDNPAGYEKTSSAARAKELHGRLLLVHGTSDDNVHPQNTWRFADELIEAGITFDMMIYPTRDHRIADDAAQKHLFATMLEFWNRNLK
jgi:dipeptidyl-peptidase-4